MVYQFYDSSSLICFAKCLNIIIILNIFQVRFYISEICILFTTRVRIVNMVKNISALETFCYSFGTIITTRLIYTHMTASFTFY